MKTSAVLIGLSILGAGWALIGAPANGPQRQRPQKRMKRQGIAVKQSDAALQVATNKVEFDTKYRLIALPTENINTSMKDRRDLAWAVVDQVWEPVAIPGGKIPTWMTWYEQEDIKELYQEMMQSLPRKRQTTAQVIDTVKTTLANHRQKDIRASLNSVRLGRVLRQFNMPGFGDLGPHRTKGTGSIYYNPAYVTHFLENAATIAAKDPAAFPKPDPQSNKVLTMADVPANLRSQDPNNVYALCMDSEMPPEAMMIKVEWLPVDAKGNVKVPFSDTTAKMATKMSPPPGTWIQYPVSNPSARGSFEIKDEHGKTWMLAGMHIASKQIRTWLWVSLFASAFPWSWTADVPQGPFRSWFAAGNDFLYGMCVVSDFREGDPAPGAHYVGQTSPNTFSSLDALGSALKAVNKVMKGAQWGANPYIEATMPRGNCIGCHQAATGSFLTKTTGKVQSFGVSDFSFSFATNRDNIRAVNRQLNR